MYKESEGKHFNNTDETNNRSTKELDITNRS